LFSRKIKYLGYIILEKGIATDPEKTLAIENWPIFKKRSRFGVSWGFVFIIVGLSKDFLRKLDSC